MANDKTKKDWLDSKETRQLLGISSCELSHVREDGKLHYRKEGNAYRYLGCDVRKSAKEKH